MHVLQFLLFNLRNDIIYFKKIFIFLIILININVKKCELKLNFINVVVKIYVWVNYVLIFNC